MIWHSLAATGCGACCIFFAIITSFEQNLVQVETKTNDKVFMPVTVAVVLERADVDIDKVVQCSRAGRFFVSDVVSSLMFPSRRSIRLSSRKDRITHAVQMLVSVNVAPLAGTLCEHFLFTQYLVGSSLCHLHMIDLFQDVLHFRHLIM